MPGLPFEAPIATCKPLHIAGMGARLTTFYRRRSATDAEHQKLAQGGVQYTACWQVLSVTHQCIIYAFFEFARRCRPSLATPQLAVICGMGRLIVVLNCLAKMNTKMSTVVLPCRVKLVGLVLVFCRIDAARVVTVPYLAKHISVLALMVSL